MIRTVFTSSAHAGQRRVLFVYWGRRGLSRLVERVMEAAGSNPSIQATLSFSRQNRDSALFERFAPDIIPLDTFESGRDALFALPRMFRARRVLLGSLAACRFDAVVNLMPHVWSPLISPALGRAGVAYFPICHDAERHPGDRTGFARRWIEQDYAHATRVITLSEHVRRRIIERGVAAPERIASAFLPDLDRIAPPRPAAPQAGEPWRILFLGRLQAYKGLSLFADAIADVIAAGIPLNVEVRGEGHTGAAGERLRALGARIENRWHAEHEITTALDSAHFVVNAHTEASQSGIVPLALGRGLPVVVTPVGGLPEQVRHGRTGLVASATSGPALAHEIARIARSERLYTELVREIEATRHLRSVELFVQRLVEIVEVGICSGRTA